MLSYLRMVSSYLQVFFGEKTTLSQKVRLAGKVVGLLRRARCYVVSTPGLTLKEHLEALPCIFVYLRVSSVYLLTPFPRHSFADE